MKADKLWLFISCVVICFGCNTQGNRSTEHKYLNKVDVPSINYSKDSIELLSHLRKRLIDKVEPFNIKGYGDSTIILLDTIMYNNQQNKVAVFASLKNPTSRLADPDTSYEYYYDSYCFLSQKSDSTSDWSISWFSVFNIVTYYNLNNARNRIRYKYFNELASVKDINGDFYYKYNLNDKRFWNGVAWE